MKKEWWREASGYQIYIRSFKDGNGDGIGDLKGIKEKLEYIKDLGVDFIWICPFYSSPMDDNGYDVKDYFKIAKEYGTMNDLKKLILSAHSLGLKVVLDLVLNHTSITNKWFELSEKGVEPYSDMYIWKDGIIKDGKIFPPNNWQSFFSGNAWEYSEKRKQYYLHIFSKTMPDLNYENDITFDEIKKVIEYYASLGIDGFRVDAVAHIGKDLSFKNGKRGKTYLSFSNMPKTHEYLRKLSGVFEANNLVTIGEMGGEPTKKDLIKYTNGELNVVCDFAQMGVFKSDNTIDEKRLLKVLKRKNNFAVKGGWSALFWLNHDYPRLISKLSGMEDSKNASLCLATLMYMLKGTPIIYNGEEIGMTNYPFERAEDFRDVNAKMILSNSKNPNEELERLKQNSRDNARTIMQWNNEKYAGFSTTKPWIHVNKNYKKINVMDELGLEHSMLNNYKKILETRKNVVDKINGGKYSFFGSRGVLGYDIMSKNEKITIVANMDNRAKMYNATAEILYSNQKVKAHEIKPYQVIVFKKSHKIR